MGPTGPPTGGSAGGDYYDSYDDYSYDDYSGVKENDEGTAPISQGYGVPSAEPISTGYGVPRAEPLGDNYGAATKEPDSYDSAAEDYSYEEDYYNAPSEAPLPTQC